VSPLSVSNTSSNVALPSGASIIVYNVGSNGAYVTLGGNAVVATTSDDYVGPNSWISFSVGTNTYLAAITSSSTTTLNISGGSGQAAGAGGGGATGTTNVNLAQVGGTSTSTNPLMVATSTAPVTATNTALTVDLRPDSPGIVALGQAANAASVPVVLSSGQVGTAGSANATVLSVQGIASGTNLPVSQATAANLNAAVVGTGTAGSPAGNILTIQGVASMQPVIENITQSGGTNLIGTAGTVPSSNDPCSYAKKNSVAIAVSTATTTALVAVSGSTTVYVCGFDFSIAASATTATTAQLEYGTGAACVTTHTALTGTYGSGDAAVSTTPTVISRGDGSATVLAGIASNGICIVTAGTTNLVEGSLTYVQQ
jgi:hypothetical protein